MRWQRRSSPALQQTSSGSRGSAAECQRTRNRPPPTHRPRRNSGRSSSCDVVLDDAVQGAKPVLPADLFAFRVGASGIGNADLVNPRSDPGHLGGDFGLEAETVLLDPNAVYEFAAIHPVAGLHNGAI